jgi:hypothetical protein
MDLLNIKCKGKSHNAGLSDAEWGISRSVHIVNKEVKREDDGNKQE